MSVESPSVESRAETPLAEFARWHEDAIRCNDPMANCFVLATVGESAPSARVVSYRPGPAGEFRFFTNYRSRKGRELSRDPMVAAVFLWLSAGRQVRVEGEVEQLDRASSEAYFAGRPLEHQLATVLSQQSESLSSLTALRRRHQSLLRQHRERGSAPSCPEGWGGYELSVARIELCQRGSFRMPERRFYQRTPRGWEMQLLSP